jgi:hypothetical protein
VSRTAVPLACRIARTTPVRSGNQGHCYGGPTLASSYSMNASRNVPDMDAIAHCRLPSQPADSVPVGTGSERRETYTIGRAGTLGCSREHRDALRWGVRGDEEWSHSMQSKQCSACFRGLDSDRGFVDSVLFALPPMSRGSDAGAGEPDRE